MENYNSYFEKMIKDSLHTSTIKKVKEGQLVVNHKCIEVVDSTGKNYYLTSVKDEVHGNTENKILKEFVNNYTYSDIQKEFDKMIEENTRKVELAEVNKTKLENLMQDIKGLESFEKVEILANNHLIEYYINFEYDYNFKIEIYYINDNEFRYRFNYSNETVNKKELIEKIDLVIQDIKEVEKEKEIKVSEKRKEDDKKRKINDFAKDNIGKKILLKLKNGVTCVDYYDRFSVGKGKSGKYYSCRGYMNVIDYINSKDIKEYIIIEDTKEYFNYTNKDFKTLNWNSIY